MSDELEQGQASLGKALEQARAGEDKQLAQQVRDGGEQMVRILTGLLRLMRTHSPDNHAFDQPVRDLGQLQVRLVDLLGAIHMVCVEGQIYVNDIRVRMDERVGGAADLQEELARHGCGGLSFAVPLVDAQIRALVHLLAAKASGERPLGTLQAALRAGGLEAVTVHGMYRLRLTGETAPARQADGPRDNVEIQGTLSRAAGLVSEAWDNLSAARVPNPLPVRRLVNDIIDNTGWAEQFLEAEQSGPSVHALAHARHSLRTCTLAVMIGAELGLPPASLADLGVSAMFHDVGYGAREDGFPPPFERHGSAGARMLLRQRGFHQAKIKRLLVVIEHHRPLAERPSLYSRIVRIADDFDTLTRYRPGGPLYGPADAIALMDGATGQLYDPLLMQLFINRVGRYPPGTLLRLRDNRWVVSVSGVRSAETFAKPLCRLVRGLDGKHVADGPHVDLALEGEVVRVIPVRE